MKRLRGYKVRGDKSMVTLHKDLKLWQESMILVEDVYKITVDFPKEEMFGLISQIKRSVVSIPSTIAEGAGRKGKTEFIRFLYIALGSTSELETQLDFCPLRIYAKE